MARNEQDKPKKAAATKKAATKKAATEKAAATEADAETETRPRWTDPENVARREAWAETVELRYQPALPIDDAAAEAVAETLDVPVKSEHVAATIEAVRVYDLRERARRTLPPGDHRKGPIEALRALADALAGLDINAVRVLYRCGLDLSGIDVPRAVAAAREAAETMEQWRQQAPRLYRPSEWPRATLLRELGAIYERATGRRPRVSKTAETRNAPGNRPTGRFFRFLRAATALSPDLAELGDHALATAAKRAIGRGVKRQPIT